MRHEEEIGFISTVSVFHEPAVENVFAARSDRSTVAANAQTNRHKLLYDWN
jgi:hypothetical protein